MWVLIITKLLIIISWSDTSRTFFHLWNKLKTQNEPDFKKRKRIYPRRQIRPVPWREVRRLLQRKKDNEKKRKLSEIRRWSHARFLQRCQHLVSSSWYSHLNSLHLIWFIFLTCIKIQKLNDNKIGSRRVWVFWKGRERGKIKITFIFHVTIAVLYNVCP